MNENEIKEEWFKTHKAEYSILKDEQGNEVEKLKWRRPETSNYAVWYIRMESVLFVTGDLGSAVYRWGEFVTLEWISRCDIGYFAEKCEASENGRRYQSWDSRKAEKRFEEFVKESTRLREGAKKKLFKTVAEAGALSRKDEWHDWLRMYGDTIFGVDNWYELGDIGMTVSPRCIAHLAGLKMAFEQIEKPVNAT